ncbi:MAG: peptidoglycan editing factor PgeF [Anaerolineaceae bacterium]|nr:peptidoglycan editing factor PgeF [Anaerolineaceae bacterium]
MAAHITNGLLYYTFESFDQVGVIHGAFTRQGGVSPSPWKSLNVGGMVGDAPEHIVENRRRCFAALGRDVHSLYDCWLVHGVDAIRVDQPRGEADHLQADILLTDHPDVTLFMRYADCVPILLFDPVRRVIGLVHAGWVGSVNKVAKVAVERMVEWYRSDPANMRAVIGPSICVNHYPVGPEVIAKMRSAFGVCADDMLVRCNGQEHFNLWMANRWILEQAGVQQIEVAGICTACHPEEWFSHRAENRRTGRFGMVLALNEDG